MPLNFIDISSWQGDIDLSKLPIDAVFVKATEGTSYVNPWCDPKVQQARNLGLPFGFYHYAKSNNPIKECEWLLSNTIGYRELGIPALDWEENQSVDWVNQFVRHYHDVTGVWPWIYSNPRFFNQGGVEANCGRWVAKWPNVSHPNFDTALGAIPECDGLICAWQFASDGRISGYNGNLDLDKFFGTREAWQLYAKPNASGSVEPPASGNSTSVLENDEYKIIVEKKS